MKKLMVVSITTAEGCVLYRSHGPLSLLKDEFQIVVPKDTLGWMDFVQCDAVFFQYPMTAAHEQVVTLAKRLGIPVWVDYDDDFTCVQEGNMRYELYQATDVQERIKRIISMADVVSVSTPVIAASVQRWTGNPVHVHPNAYDMRFHGEPNFARRTKTITWRGADSHQVDIAKFSDAILKMQGLHPDLTWAWLGQKPGFLTHKLAKKVTLPGQDAIAFLDSFKGMAPLIHMVPLEDCEANLGKSNIAWLEATAAGAACVAPAWPEWKQEGIWGYHGPEEFLKGLQYFAENPTEAIEANHASWLSIQEKFMVEHINEQRRQVLRDLFK